MTHSRDEIATAELREYLHTMHGHRIGLMRQMVGEGDYEAAARQYGEMIAYQIVLHLLEGIEADEPLDFSVREEYDQLSKAVLAADERARDSNGVEPRGMH